MFRSVAGAVIEGCGFEGQRGECVELRRVEPASAADALALSSSEVSAPTMAEATAGRDSSHASETW